MKKILVLGSSGQIGRPLCNTLRELNYEVVEFDIMNSSLEDLRKKDVLDEVLPEIDFAFFLAFDVGGSIYLKQYQDTYKFMDNNIKLMAYTFDSLKKHNTKFLFSTTQMSDMSFSTYGVLKRVGEMYTKILGGIIAKFWNVYGYELDLNKSHVITDFIIMAKDKGEINMITDGTEYRQFLYSEDCCDCLVELMCRCDELDPNKNIHISSFEWSTINDIASIISGNFNDCGVNRGESKDMVQQDSKYEPDPYILNFWKPKTTLNDGISKIIKNYL
jgi:nucleoside-diphosphate-sugar epimerase